MAIELRTPGPKLADVEKENTELKAKIAALKDKLGITAQEEKDEQARIKATFSMFDRDGDGVIDKNEFELLAFECGTDVAALTPENLGKALAAINPKGDGKITLEDFQKWLKSDKGVKGSKGAQLGMLRMKLQSKAWLTRLNDVRSKYGKAKGDKKDAKAAAAPAPKAAPVAADKKASAASAAAASSSPPDSKDAKDMKLLNLQFAVGQFGDAKAGVYLDVGPNEALAKSTKETVSCPDGVNFFTYIDLALRDGFDEAKVGELAGALDGIMNAVPWQQLPMQVYQSHSVDVVTAEGKKVLRIALFSSFDPEELAAPMLQASQTDLKTSQILTGAIKLEFPFEVGSLKEPQFRLTPDNLKGRLGVQLDINRKLKDAMQGLLQMMPPEARLSILGFFVKGIDVNVQFANLTDFLKTIPDGQGRRGPGQELRQAINELGQIPIADMLPQVTAAVPAIAAQAGQKALYDSAKANLLGVRRVHVQMHDMVLRINLKGIDFMPLFP